MNTLIFENGAGDDAVSLLTHFSVLSVLQKCPNGSGSILLVLLTQYFQRNWVTGSDISLSDPFGLHNAGVLAMKWVRERHTPPYDPFSIIKRVVQAIQRHPDLINERESELCKLIGLHLTILRRHTNHNKLYAP